MLKPYQVVALGAGGLRYGVKGRDGIYVTDRAEAATAFESDAEARELAEALSEVHERIGLKFEVKRYG